MAYQPALTRGKGRGRGRRCRRLLLSALVGLHTGADSAANIRPIKYLKMALRSDSANAAIFYISRSQNGPKAGSVTTKHALMMGINYRVAFSTVCTVIFNYSPFGSKFVS